MNELLVKIMPNVIEYFPDLIKATIETLQMVSISTAIASLIGIPLGVLLLVTAKGHERGNGTTNHRGDTFYCKTNRSSLTRGR